MSDPDYELDLTDVEPATEPLEAVGVETVVAAVPYLGGPAAGDLAARAAAALRDFPHPTGPRRHWPLSEGDLGQLVETAARRAPIRRAAALYLALFFAGAIATANLGVLLVIRTSRANAVGRTLAEEISARAMVWLGVVGGLSVLCLLAARGAYRCHLWAPIAMIVHFAGWVFFFGYQFVRALGDFRWHPEAALFAASSIIPPAIFLGMSIQMIVNLRKFLRRPVWTIHALIASRA
jgi:hypothetical protein